MFAPTFSYPLLGHVILDVPIGSNRDILRDFTGALALLPLVLGLFPLVPESTLSIDQLSPPRQLDTYPLKNSLYRMRTVSLQHEVH